MDNRPDTSPAERPRPAARSMRPGALACLVLVTSIAPDPVAAFGTINGDGQMAEHEHITRLALKGEGIGANTLGQIAGRNGTLGAIGAPDNLLGGMLLKAAAHCDGGDYLAVSGYPQTQAAAQQALQDCRDWMDQSMKAAVTAAGGMVNAAGVIQTGQLTLNCNFKTSSTDSAKCETLENLGFTMHAAQDFYAHSNWVDKSAAGAVSPSNPPGLAKPGAAPWISLRTPIAFPTGLISGCFGGRPEAGFCNYGLTFTSRVKHSYLNKDTGPISDTMGATGPGTSDRGKINGNFERAVAAAATDTTDKWRLLGELVKATYPGTRGDKIVCVLKADTPAPC